MSIAPPTARRPPGPRGKPVLGSILDFRSDILRALLDGYDDRMMVGEIYLPVERLVAYYGADGRGAHLPFNFQFVIMPTWDARAIRRTVDVYEAALPQGAWPNWVLGNHDNQRIATKVGREQTRLAHMLLLTLRGTPTCYYG